MANKALKIDRQKRSKHREELGDDWMKRRRPGLAGGNGYDLRVGLGEGSDSARVIMEGRTAIKKTMFVGVGWWTGWRGCYWLWCLLKQRSDANILDTKMTITKN